MRQVQARPALLGATAVLLIAGLLGAVTAVGPGPAGAVAVPGWTVPVAAPPGTSAIVNQVVAAERQITSLGAYVDAETYLKVAKADAAAAHRAYVRSVGELVAARAEVRRARVAKATATATVNLYDQALCELGIVEYTGIAVRDNLDLPSQETEVEQLELGNIAARDTGAGLQNAKSELARSIKRLHGARLAAAAAKVVVAHHEALLVAAKAQSAMSAKTLDRVRQWVLVPGKAPARPSVALVSLEGKLALQVKRAKLALLALATNPGAPATGIAAGIPSLTTTTKATTAGTTAAASGPTATRPGTTAKSKEPPPNPAVVAAVRQAEAFALAASGPGILGTSILSAAQIGGWFESTGAQANIMVPITQLVADYVEAGRLTGVRADLAFAQSVVETGYFAFPPGGQLTPKNNNFAGIGACDKCKHGWSFASPMDGIVAQEALLSQYAGMPRAPSLSSIAAGGVQGCCSTWMALAGVWATNRAYGFEIMSVYKQMLDWALSGEEKATGLVPPAPPPLAPATVPPAPGWLDSAERGLVPSAHLRYPRQHPVVVARHDEGFAVAARPRQVDIEGRAAVRALGPERGPAGLGLRL